MWYEGLLTVFPSMHFHMSISRRVQAKSMQTCTCTLGKLMPACANIRQALVLCPGVVHDCNKPKISSVYSSAEVSVALAQVD